ncbi:hypothetical protein PC123_g22310 [Phytophthora cactorum]|nr:hypothetical protein PC123_g22310 [Phytophthora cactorum]
MSPLSSGASSTVDPSIVEENIAVSVVTGSVDSKVEDAIDKEYLSIMSLPASYRSLIRQAVYQLVKNEELNFEFEACRKQRESLCDVKRELGEGLLSIVSSLGGTVPAKMRPHVMKYATERFERETKLIRFKLRTRVPRGCEEQPHEKPRPSKRVRFELSTQFSTYCEELGDLGSTFADVEKVGQYVCVVRDSDRHMRKPGLVEVSADEDDLNGDVHGLVPEGKHVIGSVGGAEAVSAGYIDCVPVELLFDSGAIASLVDYRVLHRIGKAEEPLGPYEQSLRGVGRPENPHTRIDRLRVDAILGTDALQAFRAVIDLDDSTLTLKSTGEVFRLGSSLVEEMFVARIGSTMHLPPGGQALVRTEVQGRAPDGLTVLVKGLPDLDATLKVARALCCGEGGQLVVEVCNALTEDMVIKKGTQLAAASVVPESAFENLPMYAGDDVTENVSSAPHSTSWVDAVISAVAKTVGQSSDPMPELEEVLQEELDIDFSSSKLSEEQQSLMRALLESFRDMFVETSMNPGRTDLMEFSIDTGKHPPLKQRPYRVSKAEGGVKEAEIQKYLELKFIRPSMNPWASPVLMIRKPDVVFDSASTTGD